MFTRPDDLTDKQLVSELADHWHLHASSVEYVAVGFGSHHWRANADGQQWFVTVDDLHEKLRSVDEHREDAFGRLRAALQTARSLRDLGLSFVVAPLPTIAAEVVRRMDKRFALAVYPNIVGRVHPWGEYQSRADRVEVMTMIVAVHDVPRRAVAAVRADDFRVPNRDELERAIDGVEHRWDSGPYAERARALLTSNARTIDHLLEHYDRLAAEAAARPDRTVVTHGEPHIGNTVETDTGWVLIDWDTVLLAPPERDLWTLAKGDDSIIEAYTAITGREISTSALEMYQLGWDLSEIAIYTALFRRPHDDSIDVRESWANLELTLDAARRHTGSTDRT